MTSPIDYNQHLLAYLQAWRQLLEASAAMTSTMPFPSAAPGMPPAPPMPVVPPMVPPATSPLGASPSTDYAQHLFGYLQAWRQYLEQAVGADTTPQPTGSHSTGASSAGSQSTGEPPTGSQPTGSQSSSALKAPVVTVPPKDDYGTITDFGTRFRDKPLTEPDNLFVRAERASGSAFAGKTVPAPASSAQTATRSLFSERSADRPSATVMTGGDVRRAAPEATSRWWEAGQGRRPGFKDKPDVENTLDLAPNRDFGSR